MTDKAILRGGGRRKPSSPGRTRQGRARQGRTRGGRTRQDAVELLRASALELFVARGYDHVTVEEIAAHAGVSPRTFYRRFGTKESVVLWDLERASVEILAAVDAQPPGVSPSELVVGAVMAFSLGRRPVDTIASIKEILAYDDPARRAEPGSVFTHHHPTLRPHFESIFARIEDGLAERLANRFGGEPTDPLVRTGAGWMATSVRIAALEWVDSMGVGFVERVTPLFVKLGAALELCFARN